MNFEKLEQDVKFLIPSLGKEGRILVEFFMPIIRAQGEEINLLRQENKALKDQLSKNSRNSSQPPSQDVNRPVKRSSEERGVKRPAGGQKGHKGQGGKLKDNPDHIVSFQLGECPDCGHNLRQVESEEVVRRQMEDIPPIKTVVTEYQIEVKTCPGCAVRWQAGGCEQPHEFEYGPRVKALAVYLSTYQFLPQKRIKELLSVFGVHLSTGTLNNFRKSAAKHLEPFVEELRKKLEQAPAAYFDETGIRVGGQGHWIHVACNKLYALFGIFRSRGKKAHEEMGVLPGFKGTAHRDFYAPYDAYTNKSDSMCCGHIVRELRFAIENDGQQLWAKPMKDLLLQVNKQVEARKDGVADPRWQGRHRKKYRALVHQGLAMNPEVKRPEGQTKGATKQSKSYNLLKRLGGREEDILRFMVEPLAEFTNNQAERDLRMNKVRAKVSGGFRELKPAQEYMRIRSLISTAVKQAVCPLQSLEQLFTKGNLDYMNLINTV